ncbi:unnamed protein product, partial [marine sediment metagenome]
MSWIQDNKLVAGSVQQKEIAEGDYTDSELVIKNAKLGDTLTEFEIDINIGFNGTAPKASIGIDSDHEKYMTELQSDIKARGTYVIEETVILVADETIKLYITPDGSTA